MKDDMMIGFIIYLLIGSFAFGLMPSSFFNGTTSTQEFNDLAEVDSGSTPSLKQISFIGKVVRFLFIPVVIDGIPLMIAGIINIINILGVIMGIVWGYNKVRGIS